MSWLKIIPTQQDILMFFAEASAFFLASMNKWGLTEALLCECVVMLHTQQVVYETYNNNNVYKTNFLYSSS